MTIPEIEQAVANAEAELRRIEACVHPMAKVLEGRLRAIKSWSNRAVLVRLKRELQDFNAQSRTWRDE